MSKFGLYNQIRYFKKQNILKGSFNKTFQIQNGKRVGLIEETHLYG